MKGLFTGEVQTVCRLPSVVVPGPASCCTVNFSPIIPGWLRFQDTDSSLCIIVQTVKTIPGVPGLGVNFSHFTGQTYVFCSIRNEGRRAVYCGVLVVRAICYRHVLVYSELFP